MKKYLPIYIIVLLSVVSLSIYGKEEKKEEFKTNTLKENENKFTIAAYINGVFSDTMPSESKYFGYVECRNSSGNKLDTLGFVEWENNKWNVRITDITKASTCNVYFIDPPAHWLDAGEGTLLKAIKDNNKVENVKTIPGKQINKEDEALLSGTYDDYGTSYYFRGNVQNNYVQFANKCWRIVRVDGNGNTKLWLWNNAESCNASNVPSSVFNENYNHNAYVGFMYGNIESDKFSTEDEMGIHDNIYDSTILSNLKSWYDTTFKTNDEINPTKYTDLLADVIWCNDKKDATKTTIRIQNDTLKCPDAIENDINNISRFTAYKNTDINNVKGNGKLKRAIEGTNPVEYKYYKIGLLTYEEVIFAGGCSKNINESYYLYTNSRWWAMTPYNFNGTASQINHIREDGRISSNWTSVSYGMRPSIAFIPTVLATYDTESEYAPGTINNPYIVEP